MMIWRTLLLLLVLLLSVGEGHAFPLRGAGLQPIVYNILSLGSSPPVCDGTTNDGPNFVQASIALQALVASTTPVEVDIPAGHTCLLTTCTLAGNPYYDPLFYGFKNFTLNATGATIEQTGSGCAGWGNHVLYQSDATKIALFQTSSVGASCVTVVTAGQESRFAVGNWTMPSGLALQTIGYPPNFGFFEYRQIASVNTSSHQVCFTQPLHYAYKSTWPSYDQATTNGGPATLFLLQPDWDARYAVIGGTWNYASPNEVDFAASHYFTLSNISVVAGGWVVSLSGTVTVNNINQTGTDEIDKDIDTLTFNGGSIANGLSLQSASIHVLALNNISIDNLQGMPQKTTCNGATIGILRAGSSYGASGPFQGTNCAITTITHGTLNSYGAPVSAAPWSVTGGVFTAAVASVGGGVGGGPAAPATWAVPSGNIVWSGKYEYEGGFTIGDLTESDPNFSISSSLSGGIPGLPQEPTASILYAAADPYPNWSCSGCTGSADAVDYSQAGAQNAPLYTYSNRTYTCAANLANVPDSIDLNNLPSNNGPIMWGAFTSMTANVITADTGSNPTLTFYPQGLFGGILAGNSFIAWAPIINLKIAGTRAITTSGTSGAQSGDTLSSPGTDIMTGVTNPAVSADLSSEAAGQCPVVQVTWQTSR